MPPSDRRSVPPRPGRGDRPQVVTSTGWRLVGSAAELVSDPLIEVAGTSLAHEDILYAATFLVRPRSGKGEVADVVLSVLNRALAGARGDGAEPLGRAGSLEESSGRFHAVRWDTFASNDRWAGELVWVHPHPVIKGVPCTTRVALMERGRQLELVVHVGAGGGLAAVRGYVGAGQARPAFLSEMNRLVQLGFDRGNAEPRVLDAGALPSFVRNTLLSEARTYPVALLAPVEPLRPGEPTEYLVPPATVAEELLGLAHLYVIDVHPTTFVLSDVVGDRRLSCFRGALRVYLPGFSLADDPMEHPLLIHERVEDPVERAGVLGRLGREARERVPMGEAVTELRRASSPQPEPVEVSPSPSGEVDAAVPAVAEPSVEASVPEAPEAAAPGLAALGAALERMARAITRKLDEMIQLQTELVDEVARLRTVSAVRAANAAGVERRLGQFERLLREHLRAPADAGLSGSDGVEAEAATDDQDEDVTLVSVVQHAEAEYADALLILESAVASAQESPYQDVQRVAVILKAMAELARRRQEGKLGMSLREAFGELGIDYRGAIAQSTSQRLRQQYLAALPDGQTVECHEHLVLGSSYDPRYCLRIYFTSRAPAEPRFVIAHVGRHFEVLTTT